MSFLKNKWLIIALVMLCWAIVSSSVFGYYYYQYTDLIARLGGVPIPINLGIDCANGTRNWVNGTVGVTLYDAMIRAGWKVNATSFDVMGLYVTSINGLAESFSNSNYWGWWTWTQYGWSHGGSACNKYIVTVNETIIWYYSYTDPATWQMTPPP